MSSAVAAVSLPAAAMAQAAAGGSESAEELGEVVVTGSRIRRTELTAVQPIQVITSESLDKRGFTNVADALNELPSFGVPTNPTGDQASFSTGRNFVNLFGLGTNRTLTLVNGRRFVSGNPASLFVAGNTAGGQVDLNVIPTGFVDRVEIIQAGGSAVYGSDAIAGVVNVITKTEYDGIEVDGQFGISDQNDAETYRGRILAGKKLLDDRLSVFGSYEYNETTALSSVDRKVTARQLAFAANPLNTSGSDGIPGSIVIFDRRVPETTLGGIPFRTGGAALSGILTIPDPANPANRVPAQFGPGGVLIPYNPGQFFQASIGSGGGGLNLGELTSLVSPVKRHVGSGFLKYQITDNIKFTSELLYSHSESVEPFNQPIFNAPVFGGLSASLQFSTANPFLPAATRAAILAQPTLLPVDPANPGERLFFLSRSSADIGSNKTESESDTYRGVFAFEGSFELAGRNLNWDVSANFGETKGRFQTPGLDQNRFIQAINATRDASGNIICAQAAARAGGCAPLNLFGLGAPSDAALQYVNVLFESRFKVQQTVYQANFGGEALTLPAGTVNFNVGYEYRLEKSDFNPNDAQEAGIGRSAAIASLQGKYDTKEYYGEISVPIFGDGFNFLGMHRLEAEGQFRKVDNSLAGKDEAWQVGGRWYPIEDLLIRGHISESFRAPAITELFLPTSSSFATATDPCDSRNINTGPNPAARLANCQAAFQALGLPANFNLISQVQAATVQGVTAGSPTLKNELADQWSIGFVYQPSFIPGLALSFDWVDIELTDAIVNFNLTSILQVCFDSPTPPADVCSRFQRGTSALGAGRQGQILTVGEPIGNGMTAAGFRSGFVNAGYRNFEGFTAGVDYNVNLEELFAGAFKNWFNNNPGRLSLNLQVQNIDTLNTSISGLGFDLDRDESEIGYSTWQWKNQIGYTRDNLQLTWTTSYAEQAVFNNDFTLETRQPLGVDEYFIHDFSLTYDFGDMLKDMGMGFKELQGRVIVRNVFDEEPPFGATGAAAATGIGTYDVIGRYFQVGLRARF